MNGMVKMSNEENEITQKIIKVLNEEIGPLTAEAVAEELSISSLRTEYILNDLALQERIGVINSRQKKYYFSVADNEDENLLKIKQSIAFLNAEADDRIREIHKEVKYNGSRLKSSCVIVISVILIFSFAMINFDILKEYLDQCFSDLVAMVLLINGSLMVCVIIVLLVVNVLIIRPLSKKSTEESNKDIVRSEK